MKIIYPDWAIANPADNSFQCGGCLHHMYIKGRGEVPHLEIGFRHHHHADCVLASHHGDWEALSVKIGEIARLLLGDNQPATIVPPFPDLRDPPEDRTGMNRRVRRA